MLTGQPLQIFERSDESEVTSLTVMDKRRTLFAVGWSKKIATYSEINYEIVSFNLLFLLYVTFSGD